MRSGEKLSALTKPFDEAQRQQVRHAVIGGFARLRLPFLRFAADFAVRGVIRLHIDRLDVVDAHLRAQLERHRERRLRVIFRGKDFKFVRSTPNATPSRRNA